MNTKKLEFLKSMAKGLVSVFGQRCEVVIHDFQDMAKSVVHVEGDVTNRSIGAPITDLVFRIVQEFGNDAPDKAGYKNTTSDGRQLKCATFFVRDDEDNLEGCLCINFDISDFMYVSNAFSDLTFLKTDHEGETPVERYAQSFSDTMESIIDNTVAGAGKPPSMMDKSQKMTIIRNLEQQGVFMIKGSVNYLAKVFGASRYTIYNYLKEIREG
ncbi:MAG: transcriptional regulator [Desulfobacteraceae bacterium]|nr:transcriptional regulator [Desulfobacteraceae bacterium]